MRDIDWDICEGLVYSRYENAFISLKYQRDNGMISEDEFWGITRLLRGE